MLDEYLPQQKRCREVLFVCMGWIEAFRECVREVS